METTEICETSVDIDDPIGFYADEGMLRRRLQNDYVGKCKCGYYITGILEILKKSGCSVNMLAGGAGRISVVFKVRALRYHPGDIVAGCSVQNKTENSIHCRKGPLQIMLGKSKHSSAISTGDSIIVRLTSLYFSPGMEIISAGGEIFTFSKELVVYRVDLARIDRDIIAEMLAGAAADFEETKSTTWRRVFATAWAQPQSLPEGAEKLSLLELLGAGVGSSPSPLFLARDNRLDITSDSVVSYSAIPPGVAVRDCESSEMAIYNLLWGFRNILKAVRDLEKEHAEGGGKSIAISIRILAATRLS